MVSDERGLVRVTFSRPDLLSHKAETHGTINGTIKVSDGTINTPGGTINEIAGTITDTLNGPDGTIKASGDTINDTINQNARVVYELISVSPGISAVALAEGCGKSIITVKRALKTLVERKLIEYRGSKKTGGYYKF